MATATKESRVARRDRACPARMHRFDGARAGLADHRYEPSGDLDAEPWLDEGAGASSDAVTK